MRLENLRICSTSEFASATSSPLVVSDHKPWSAFPNDTTAQISSLVHRYQRSRRAIPVSFRKMVPWLKIGERATHYLHPYPAKLLPHIAHFFLASDYLCPPGGLVLDPFGGSGTVALESCLSGRPALYADTNPLARLIAEAKVNIPQIGVLDLALEQLGVRFQRSRTIRHPPVVNIDKWFSPKVIRGLARLKSAISGESSPDVRRFLDVTFSATVRRVSNADLRLSVPVLAKTPLTTATAETVWKIFRDQFSANVKRIEELTALCPAIPKFEIAGADARRLISEAGGSLQPNSVDLVITSPPYAGAQKYIRASSLSLGWLGIAGSGELKPLENQTIGREHFPKNAIEMAALTSVPAANRIIEIVKKKNPTRAAICSTYINEMEEVIGQIYNVLKPAGYFILVIGNNEVCGEKFLSSEYLHAIAINLGFQLKIKMVDEIKSRGLMTKRNKTASMITREWVLVFRKEG